MSDELRHVPALIFMPPRSMPCGCDRRYKSSSIQAMVAVGDCFFVVCVKCEAAVEIPPERVKPEWREAIHD